MMARVLHVPYCFPPDPSGGTEVYVEALAREQRKLGVETTIAAPGPRTETYDWNGLRVYRFAIGRPSLTELYGDGDPSAVGCFREVLEAATPDVVHLHAFTSAVSLGVVRAVKRVGLPVVFTYHTPTVSCARGTLLEWGQHVCDGRLEPRRCARCTLHGLGMNRVASWIIGYLPAVAGRALGDLGLAGRPWTALRMTELMTSRQKAFRSLMSEVDRVVAVCEWVRAVLLLNEVPPGKIILSRQGLPTAPQEESVVTPAKPRGCPLRVAFLGRVSAVKGIDVLVESILRDPQLRVRLDIYGVVQDAEGRLLIEELERRCGKGETRIRFLAPISAGEVVDILRLYDVLAVPSQWLETGPLVVYEAFAAGIPVIGSNLGGIGELIEHERNGLLVEPASVAGWTSALRRLSNDEELLGKMTRNIPCPRTMEAGSLEMIALYNSLRSNAPVNLKK